MNPFFFPRIYIFTACLLTASTSAAYDAPRFEESLINPDALLMKGQEKGMLVEALNAVAGNFPESNLIDDDLREKSLALALLIDPLNINARATHRALLSGKTPQKSAYFVDSVTSVAGRLWDMSEALARGEPEGRKLSLYLKELSLVLHPDPPVERIRMYGNATNGKGQSWGKTVDLQPEKNPSNRKLENLFDAARNANVNRTERPPRLPGNRPGPPRPPNVPAVNMSAGAPAKILLSKAQIPFIAHIQATIRASRLGGLASLTIEEATAADEGLFGIGGGRNPAQANQLLLIGDPDGIQIAGLSRAEFLVRRDYPVWPDKMLAEIRFESELPMRSSPRLTKADTSLATSLLLHSAFSGKAISPKMVFAGEIAGDPSSGKPVISVGKNVGEILEQAKKIEGDFLLLPDRVYRELVDGAVATRQLEYLFAPQLISFTDWEQLKGTAIGENYEALTSASKAFLEIEAVQDKMSLVDLAKNDKVQERLNGIISTYPQHLSARVMLAFGKTPDNPQAILRESVRQIDQSIEPFLKMASAVAESGVYASSTKLQEAESQLEEVDVALSKFRTSLAAGAKPYLYKVEDFVEAAGKYLEITNKDSSGGEQKLRELTEAFEAMQSSRSSLGMGPINLDDYRGFGRGPRKRPLLRQR